MRIDILSGRINVYILYTKQNKIIFSRILKRHLSQGQRTILSIKLASNNVLSSVSLKKGISCNFHAGVDDSQITFVTIKMATTIGLHKIERNKDSKYIDTKVLYNIHSFISSWNSILPDDNVEQTNSISLQEIENIFGLNMILDNWIYLTACILCVASTILSGILWDFGY